MRGRSWGCKAPHLGKGPPAHRVGGTASSMFAVHFLGLLASAETQEMVAASALPMHAVQLGLHQRNRDFTRRSHGANHKWCNASWPTCGKMEDSVAGHPSRSCTHRLRQCSTVKKVNFIDQTPVDLWFHYWHGGAARRYDAPCILHCTRPAMFTHYDSV